jgi:hypothetical protein
MKWNYYFGSGLLHVDLKLDLNLVSFESEQTCITQQINLHVI